MSRLYLDSDRVTEELKEHLCVGGEGGVVMGEYGDIWDDVRSLIDQTEGKIWVSLYQKSCRGSSVAQVSRQGSS